MKIPRDISGIDLVKKLGKYGYQKTHQTGSHIRLTSRLKGAEHHITIPHHDFLKIGMLNAILNSVAVYLEMEKDALAEELFQI
jgi:predicted RNA binding protein YcfA (HicA-like mRNA interferase family)